MARNDQTDDAYYPIRRRTDDPRRSTEMPKDKKDKQAKPRPYAELFRDKEGGFRYRIKGANHEIMATSESYTTLRHASEGLLGLVRVMTKIGKRDAKDDDSWIHDLTEPAEIIRKGEEVTTIPADQAAVRVFNNLSDHEEDD